MEAKNEEQRKDMIEENSIKPILANPESKQSQKKKLKREMLKEKYKKQKELRKQKQKEKKMLQKKERDIKGAKNEFEKKENKNIGNRKKFKEERNKILEKIQSEGLTNHIGVCVDCSFDDYMHEGEVTSLVQQLNYTYGLNSKDPFDMPSLYLCFTSLNKRCKQKLEKISGFKNWKVRTSSEHFTTLFPKDKLVYLTADADEVLNHLEKGTMYVIGGIVDKNRYKNLCANEAKKYGIRTAKFPLLEHVKLKSSTVLTVNQCFELIQQFVKTNSWKEAIENVIPKRKKEDVEPSSNKGSNKESNKESNKGSE